MDKKIRFKDLKKNIIWPKKNIGCKEKCCSYIKNGYIGLLLQMLILIYVIVQCVYICKY